MELGDVSTARWTPGSTITEATSRPTGSLETLDEQMDATGHSQAARPTTPAGCAGVGRERVGGLGGSTMLRAYLGEALTGRDLVEPGIYSMTEVLAPTMIDYAAPDPGRRHGPSTAPGGGDLVPGLLRARHRQQPRRPVVPGPRDGDSGGSQGRRCGPAWPSTPTAASCSPGPAPPSRPTGASPPCSWTWTARASRCAPSRPCTAPRSSARSSSTTSPCR